MTGTRAGRRERKKIIYIHRKENTNMSEEKVRIQDDLYMNRALSLNPS